MGFSQRELVRLRWSYRGIGVAKLRASWNMDHISLWQPSVSPRCWPLFAFSCAFESLGHGSDLVRFWSWFDSPESEKNNLNFYFHCQFDWTNRPRLSICMACGLDEMGGTATEVPYGMLWYGMAEQCYCVLYLRLICKCVWRQFSAQIRVCISRAPSPSALSSVFSRQSSNLPVFSLASLV